jgi:hypothetical protein
MEVGDRAQDNLSEVYSEIDGYNSWSTGSQINHKDVAYYPCLSAEG